jgi:hypothetical protein
MLSVASLWPVAAKAQPPALDSGLPNPRLSSVMPSGGQAGKVVEVAVTGTDLEEPQSLLFSVPGVKTEPIVAPVPPPDPKKPAPKQPAPNQPAQPSTIRFKVTIPAETPIGIHDVRFVGKWGVSNPRAFVVGDLAEVLEKEPNNDVDQAQRVELNTTINGVIGAPTDVDYFVFAGTKGQRVVVSCLASSIDSRLRAGLELYDRNGRQLAFNRNYQDNDALVDCTLPADGDYYVRLFEFTYTQGTPEHFYRLTITSAPWIDAVFPPMVEPGKPATLTVYGRNLPGGQLDPSAVVDGRILEKLVVVVDAPGDPVARQRLAFGGRVPPHSSGLDGFEYRLRNPSGTSNPFLLTYAQAPVVLDNGNHNTPEAAQEIPIPCEIAGRIEKKRDRDWYAFSAKKGETYTIEVLSERLGAPTDMYFTLWNPAAKQQVVEMDDNADTLTRVKFFTRSDDPPPYRFTVPADGKYQLLVSSRDADTRASPRLLYRVRITPDQPDFRLIVMPPSGYRPDSGRLLQGGEEYFTVLVWRQDLFNGPIALDVEGLPPGVTCEPQTIAPGVREAPLVLSASPSAAPGVHELKVKGTAVIQGQPVVREARPASVTLGTQPQQNVPTISRLDRSLVVAVREQAPYQVTAMLEKETLVQGEKGNLTVKLTRLWPDLKTQLQAVVLDLPPNLVSVNNNQPITFAPDKNEAKVPIEPKLAAAPGNYTIVLRTFGQIPYNKDPMAKQKPNVNVVQPSAPVTLTVLPKQVATLTLANANLTGKVGTQNEVVVKLARLYDFGGEFKVQLVLPPSLKGVSADEVTVPGGQNEAKLVLCIAGDAAPGNRPDLIVRATALVNGNLPTVHEAKFAINVVK